MKFAIITHASHKLKENTIFSYEPYVREMNLWINHAAVVQIVAPVLKDEILQIESFYNHQNIELMPISTFDVLSFKNTLKTLIIVPKTVFKIYKTMQLADHIHLRCPGNIGLIGCFVQMFFPNKPKTAKYAGNWDPNAKQPFTYRLQKWILSQPFLTKNIQVLVYGDWPNQTKNIKPFFTATYHENEIINTFPRLLVAPLQFIFAGTLTANKRPLLCLEVIHQLKQKGYSVQLDCYGEGTERALLETYIFDNQLQNEVKIYGNVTKETLKIAYQKSHFLLFFSKSEGWPKAVAEAMFWGCVPVTTPVSCVATMLGNGQRGSLVKADKFEIVSAIESYINNPDRYKLHAQNAKDWSQQYTLECFEQEIAKLVGSLQ